MKIPAKQSEYATRDLGEQGQAGAVPSPLFGGTTALCKTGGLRSGALLTPAHLGQALPDLIEVSVFADEVLVAGNKAALTASAEYYFSRRPGATREECTIGPLGLFFSWREGAALYRLYAKNRFSLALSLNLPRLISTRHGLPGAKKRHGNSSLPLLAEGYDLAGLREGMCQDIREAVAKAKADYRELCHRAFGIGNISQVHANFSAVELAYDFAVPPAVVQDYTRAFGKVLLPRESELGLSGSLRKGERFVLYPKDESVRFETKLSGRRIKQVVGSQRVPESSQGVSSVFDALERRYLPVWLDVEAHRLQADAMTLGEFAQQLPRLRNRGVLEGLAQHLACTGRVRAGRATWSLLSKLSKRGLLTRSRIRGWRLSTPAADGCWRVWGERP